MTEKIIETIGKYVAEGVIVSEEKELFNDLGLTSLDMMSLLMDLEQVLNISIDIVDLIGTVTVADLAKNLQKYVK